MKKLAAVAFAAMLAGCGTWGGLSSQEQGTVIGAGAGAVAGRVLTDSTLGTVGGAVAGGVVGNQIGKRRDENRSRQGDAKP